MQREVALVPIAIDRFSGDGGFRRDIQHDGQRRGRQKGLNRRQPRAAQSLRFAVRDARRDVAIADEDQPAIQPALQVGLPLVPIRDVEQLHHVGAVFALALQRARDLLADRRAVVGKRDEARLVPVLFQAIAQQLGLRLLAALIQSSNAIRCPCMRRRSSWRLVEVRKGPYLFSQSRKSKPFPRHDSMRVMSSMVWRRRMTRQRPLSTRTSAGSGWRL